MNENKANYAKIGFFVLSGFALILVVIGVAGARVINKKVVYAETYFTESVAGLDIGSPVKYRGVPIGQVSRIGFVFSEYGLQRTTASGASTLTGADQILVVMAFDPEKFTLLKGGQSASFLEQQVRDGLRVKLAAAGVTGLSFLELDYIHSDQTPEVLTPVYWKPVRPYIPAAPSTMFTFKKNMDTMFYKLSEVDFPALGEKMNSFLALLQDKIKQVDVDALGKQTTSLLAELRETNQGIQRLVTSPELSTLPADVAATAGSAHRIAAKVESQMPQFMQSLQTVSARANTLADTLSGIATNSSGQVVQTVQALNQTAQAMNRTAQSHQGELDELIQNLRNASSGLNAIISDLRANPSALLFSTPPEPLAETKGAP